MSEGSRGPRQTGLGLGDLRQEPKEQASGRPSAVPTLRRAHAPLQSAWSHVPQNQGALGVSSPSSGISPTRVRRHRWDMTCSQRRSRDQSPGPKTQSSVIFPHNIPEVSEAASEGARGLRDGTRVVAGPGSASTRGSVHLTSVWSCSPRREQVLRRLQGGSQEGPGALCTERVLGHSAKSRRGATRRQDTLPGATDAHGS